MSGVKLTKAQIAALQFVAANDEQFLLHFLEEGRTLGTLISLNRRGLLSWHSNHNMTPAVTPKEYEDIRDTCSYVSITDAGRLALSTKTEGGE